MTEAAINRRVRIPGMLPSLVLILVLLTPSLAAAGPDLTFETSPVVLRGRPLELLVESDATQENPRAVVLRIERTGEELEIELREPSESVEFSPRIMALGRHVISLRDRQGHVKASSKVTVIPGVLSILPPLVAIILALVLREVTVALFMGVWAGAMIVFGLAPLNGFVKTFERYGRDAVADPDHASIILFTLLIGGTVGVITRNGGTLGAVRLVERMARSARSGQVAAWLMGLIIFFDDYANTLIVGNAIRPVTDRLRISREKLSYIVDSTAAPVASLALISTWIGYEVGLIGDALKALGVDRDPYMVFLHSIPYRFYPIFAIILVFMVAYTGRDFGPMARAEQRARTSGAVLRKGAMPVSEVTEAASMVPGTAKCRALNAFAPVLIVVAVMLLGIWVTGASRLREAGWQGKASFSEILGEADSYTALMWASLGGCAVAVILTLVQRIMSLAETMKSVLDGVKAMIPAIAILVLAWSIQGVSNDLHTADYLVGLLGGKLPYFLTPGLVFLVAAGVSFATGTSWGTMSILMPTAVPLAYRIGEASAIGADQLEVLLLGTVSSVLAGSIFGDHASPLSDTTILSSMASGSDHIDHVRTQLPYALLAALVGIVLGDVPTALGLNPWFSLAGGVLVMYAVLRLAGRKTAEKEPA